MARPPTEIDTPEALEAHLAAGRSLGGVVLQGLDLTGYADALLAEPLRGTVFLGCRFAPGVATRAVEAGALVFPEVTHLPYAVYPNRLYTVETLMAGYVPGRTETFHRTTDEQIYRHYLRTGGPRPASLLETLCRRLHDHGITDALEEAASGRWVVAVMGGHGMPRTDPAYRDVARITRRLAREGVATVCGGGPGAMEATNLGAWFAERPEAELDEGLALLARAPHYKPKEAWLDAAFAVRRAFPRDAGHTVVSIGVPTWHYGHEPPNVFATHIAKYFANSVREDGLLAMALGGVIFAPGSAGTIQEIFQDAAQNHYQTMGLASPMIFLGRRYWTEAKPVYPLLQRLAEGQPYAAHLALTDDPDEVVARISDFAATHGAG